MEDFILTPHIDDFGKEGVEGQFLHLIIKIDREQIGPLEAIHISAFENERLIDGVSDFYIDDTLLADQESPWMIEDGSI